MDTKGTDRKAQGPVRATNGDRGGGTEARPMGTHLAGVDADLVAVGITSERHNAPHTRDQLGQVLAAAVHLRLPAGGGQGQRTLTEGSLCTAGQRKALLRQ